MKPERERVLINGAICGIGLTFSESFAGNGDQVAIAEVSIDRPGEAASGIEGAVAARMDLTRRDSIDEVEGASAVIDISVTNAALLKAAHSIDMPCESDDKLFAVNIAGVLLTGQAVARGVIARGQGGKIINMASQASRRGEAAVAVCCATKAANVSFSQSAELDLITPGIDVGAIARGAVEGEHCDGADAEFVLLPNRPLGRRDRLVEKSVPYGRMGTAQDVVPMAVFLASTNSDYVVSQTYGDSSKS